jgi:hypothetical protein
MLETIYGKKLFLVHITENGLKYSERAVCPADDARNGLSSTAQQRKQ